MKTRKLVSLMTALILALSLVPAFAASAQDAGKSDLWFEDGLTIKWMTRETNLQKMDLDAPVLKAIKDRLNVTIELQPIPSADYATKRATVLASNTMPDVLGPGVQINEVATYAEMGMFVNLDEHRDLMPNYFALVDAEDRITETNKFRVNGSLYSFRTLEYDRLAVAPMPQLRMDLLEEQGLAAPTTWDELYDAMLKIKAAHPDMYGFSSRSGTNYLIGALAYPLGTGGFPGFASTRGMYYEPNEDRYVYAPTDEKFTRVVEFLQNAYRDGLLDPDYATMNKDQMFEKLSNGKLFCVFDNNSFTARTYNPALQQLDPNARFDLLAPMQNADGQTRAFRYERDWADQTVVNAQSEHYEDILKVIDWMYSEEGRMITNFGIEGEHYDVVDGFPTIKQEIVDRNANASDVFMAIQGEIGVGLHGFSLYIDEATYKQVSDPLFVEMGERIQQWTDDGTVVFLPNWPAFTTEEVEEITDLELRIGNVFDQEINNYITGKKSMEQWNELVEMLKAQGTERLEEIFNAAYDRIR